MMPTAERYRAQARRFLDQYRWQPYLKDAPEKRSILEEWVAAADAAWQRCRGPGDGTSANIRALYQASIAVSNPCHESANSNIAVQAAGMAFPLSRDYVLQQALLCPDPGAFFGSLAGGLQEMLRTADQEDDQVQDTGGSRPVSQLTWDRMVGYQRVVQYFQDLQLLVQEKEQVKDLVPSLPLPAGVLLYGPPGVGKTTLVGTFCNETGIPCHVVSVGELASTYINGMVERLEQHYKVAHQDIDLGSKASVIFLDELDALFGNSLSHHEEEKMHALLRLRLSSLHEKKGVLTIAAANTLARIPPSLLRPGRLYPQLHMPLPSQDALEGLLIQLCKTYGISSTSGLLPAVREGMTAATLTHAVEASVRSALVRHLRDRVPYQVDADDLREVMEKEK